MFLQFVLLLSSISSLFIVVYQLEITKEQHELTASFDKLISYLITNSKHVNADCLFGVIVAEGQFNLILKNELTDPELHKNVTDIRKKSQTLIQSVDLNTTTDDDNYNRIVKYAIKSELWHKEATFVDNTLKKLELYNWLNVTPFYLEENFLFGGPPNEKESDMCIAELVRMGSAHEVHDCIPGRTCSQLMFDMATSHGYPLTHKLLYIQMARALNCALDEEVFKTTVNEACSRILQEFRSAETTEEPLMHDLYVEQMVLCGYEGFTEFLQKKSRENLLEWQSASGCYGNNVNIVPDSTDRSQSEQNSSVKQKCDYHFSGLGAAALAINLRYLVVTNSEII